MDNMRPYFCNACRLPASGCGCSVEARLMKEIVDLRADAAWLEENGEPFESKKRFEKAAELQRRLDDLRNDHTNHR